MAAKTYAECEQEIDSRVARIADEHEETAKQDFYNRYAFEAGVAKSIAAQFMFENELLRDQGVAVEINRVRDANVAEMHQLLARMEGK